MFRGLETRNSDLAARAPNLDHAMDPEIASEQSDDEPIFPEELIEHILSFLAASPVVLTRLKAVSRSFRNIAAELLEKNALKSENYFMTAMVFDHDAQRWDSLA